jgi:hypothetical protein
MERYGCGCQAASEPEAWSPCVLGEIHDAKRTGAFRVDWLS